MAFIQGQGASNSSSSSSVSTTGASSQQQQQNEAHKSNNSLELSESTPNLTHATRVSPATVSEEKGTRDNVPEKKAERKNENKQSVSFRFAGVCDEIFHFLFPHLGFPVPFSFRNNFACQFIIKRYARITSVGKISVEFCRK